MKITKHIIAVFAIAVGTMTFAQNGEDIFKSKCNICHMLGKDGTGPNLNGVKQKWQDAGELDFLYEWVINSEALIESGKSTLALEAAEFSPTAMTPQDVTNDDIDAILAFVDAWEPPVEVIEVAVDTGQETEITYVANYKKNLSKFYFLIVTFFIQLIAILMMASSMKSFVKIQKYKNERGGKTMNTILALVGTFGIIAATSTSQALTFVDAGVDAESPWLLVEDSDLIVMLLVNLGMLFLLLHFRKLFFDIAGMVRPQVERVRISKRKQRKVNDVLTNAVPIEEEHTILLHHEYDGIRELDNNLPPWWVWMFYATITFAIIYIFHFHILKTGDLQQVEYETEVAAEQIKVDEYLESMAMNVDENNVTLMTETADLDAGKAIFDQKCAICHGVDGEGISCPNLTDNTWIYGYDIKEVFTTIKYGTPNGMMEHGSILNPIQLQQVASYAISMPEVEGGLKAEGEIVEQ